jgi:hypothetical protein
VSELAIEFNKKAFVDPKRSQQAIMDWKQAWQQRSGKDFNPVDKDKKNTTKKWERYDLGAKLTETDLDCANHIIGKGMELKIKSLYPKVSLLYLDFDSSISKVNILNRLHFLIQNASKSTSYDIK